MACVELNFGAVVFIEKLVFNVTYERLAKLGSILEPMATRLIFFKTVVPGLEIVEG